MLTEDIKELERVRQRVLQIKTTPYTEYESLLTQAYEGLSIAIAALEALQKESK